MAITDMVVPDSVKNMKKADLTETFDAFDVLQKDIMEKAEAVLEHPIVVETMDQYMGNMKIRPGTLQHLGLQQCVINATVLAICSETGIDPRVVFTNWSN